MIDDLLSVTKDQFQSEFYTNGFIQYVVLCWALTQHKDSEVHTCCCMLQWFVHLMVSSVHCMGISQFLCLPVDGHLG